MKEPAGLFNREQNIVLVGFMGAGKTTIGKQVAKKLHRDFVDIDWELEKIHNMSIPQIFARKGEKYFREQERKLIVDLCTNMRMKVISLGGGAYLQEEVRRVSLKNCMVFFLDISWEYWKEERLPLILDSRPVLKDKTMEEIKQLFLQRKDVYALNHSSIAIRDRRDEEQAADQIVESVQLAWEMEE